MLRRARRVQSRVTACSANVVLCYDVLGECSLVLRRARREQSCATRVYRADLLSTYSVSAVLRGR